MVHVDWGYYRTYPYRQHGEKLAAAGVPFWVAPGTATWVTLVGCNEGAIGSNRSAAQAAVEFAAQGYLNTDWGDFGHWQNLPVSFIGLASGAALSWCERTNSDDTIRGALAPHVFQDSSGVMGRIAFDLADTWQFMTANATNSSLLDRILRGGLSQKLPEGVTEATLLATRRHLETALAGLSAKGMRRPDANLIVDELANNARMALHACRLGLAVSRSEVDRGDLRRELAEDLSGIITERRRLWLARNREGGLVDSLRVLNDQVVAYGA
jgi:hypothetical protein